MKVQRAGNPFPAPVDASAPSDSPPVAKLTHKTIELRVPSLSGLMADSNFRLKAPLLLLILLFFSFAAFLFQNVGFSSVDLVDVSRVEFNLAKIYSVSMLLFLVLFSLVLALSVHFGYKQSTFTSLLVLPVTLLPALVLGFLFGPYLGVFLAFAVAVSSVAFFASRTDHFNFSAAYGSVGKGMLVLVVLAFLLTFLKVSAAPAFYQQSFLSSTLALVPDLGGQVAGLISGFQIDENFLRGAISKKTFTDSVSVDRVQTAVETIPGLTSFNASVRRAWAESVKSALTSDAAYNEFIALSASSIARVQAQVAEQVANDTASDAALQQALDQVTELPAVKPVFDNLPLVLAVAAASVVSLLGFFFKLFAAVFAWLLSKVMG